MDFALQGATGASCSHDMAHENRLQDRPLRHSLAQSSACEGHPWILSQHLAMVHICGRRNSGQAIPPPLPSMGNANAVPSNSMHPSTANPVALMQPLATLFSHLAIAHTCARRVLIVCLGNLIISSRFYYGETSLISATQIVLIILCTCESS